MLAHMLLHRGICTFGASLTPVSPYAVKSPRDESVVSADPTPVPTVDLSEIPNDSTLGENFIQSLFEKDD